MTYHIPPLIDAFKKCMGWLPVAYKPVSAYGPTGPFGGSAAPLLGFSGISSPLPLDLCLFCLFVFIVISYARRPRRELPPHPRRTPIIGNLSQMTNKKWLFSRECKERFSEYYRDLSNGWENTERTCMAVNYYRRRSHVPRRVWKTHHRLQ